ARLPAPDNRPYFGGAGNNELNADGAGVFVLDNTSRGYSLSASAQLVRAFGSGQEVVVAYSFTDARNAMQSAGIFPVLWGARPVKGDPNAADVSYSEF